MLSVIPGLNEIISNMLRSSPGGLSEMNEFGLCKSFVSGLGRAELLLAELLKLDDL